MVTMVWRTTPTLRARRAGPGDGKAQNRGGAGSRSVSATPRASCSFSARVSAWLRERASWVGPQPSSRSCWSAPPVLWPRPADVGHVAVAEVLVLLAAVDDVEDAVVGQDDVVGTLFPVDV